jgi:hypothetical protein
LTRGRTFDSEFIAEVISFSCPGSAPTLPGLSFFKLRFYKLGEEVGRATSYKGCRRSTTQVTDETVRTDETVTEASN